jgi:catechol 2,3-dioxygenase-like lactoylglutathione lyase family enzyme
MVNSFGHWGHGQSSIVRRDSDRLLIPFPVRAAVSRDRGDPMMPRVSLAGLTLHVADLVRSLKFSTRIPGATVEVHRPGLIAILRIGQGWLGLLQRAAGRSHIEFEVDDLDALHDTLRQAGIEPKGPPVRHPWGERDFQVVDPDGFVLEFESEACEA